MKRLAVAALAVALPVVLAGCPKKNTTNVTPKTPTNPTVKVKDPVKPPPVEAPPVKPMKQSEMKSPWRKAKVGDWVDFGTHFGMGAHRHEVVDIKDGVLYYKLKKIGGDDDGRTIPNPFADLESGFNPPEKLNPPPVVKKVDFKLKNGKVLKCKYYKREGLGSVTETWLCEDIAINSGIVKSIQNGTVQLEITDFNKVP